MLTASAILGTIHFTAYTLPDCNKYGSKRKCDIEDVFFLLIQQVTSNRSKFHSCIVSLANDVKKHCVNEELNTRDSINEKECSEELVDNICYGPHPETPFTELLATLPLWSNIMNHTFGSTNFCPSSSMTEVEFKNIKTLVFNGQRSIRVDTLYLFIYRT